ncbi:hypothetical protein, partial [Streptomyces sp. OspMP-M43]|uniref:hypothetical protein n=1 Tax=Streptomyces sp. OspMP-M43 TaxID=1839781 RepID=UPI00195FAF0B
GAARPAPRPGETVATRVAFRTAVFRAVPGRRDGDDRGRPVPPAGRRSPSSPAALSPSGRHAKESL